jgi:hypothetical protein
MNTKFFSENRKGRDHSKDLGMEGKTIRMYVKEIWREGVDWIHVA